MKKHIGNQTIKFSSPPTIKEAYSSVGKKESEGPLREYFDTCYNDDMLGQDSFEKAESEILKNTIENAVKKAKMQLSDFDYIYTGDLLNQCTGSCFGIRDFGIPYFGIYGACSTMGESLSLGAMTIDGGFADNVIAATSSHFCSSERQFRFPLEYGGVRTPTAQWTVTGSGAAILSSCGDGPKITHITTGKIVDWGVKDANNMGAAMAPAAADVIYAHFEDTKRGFDYYDAIITGDLADVGSDMLHEILKLNGVDIKSNHIDCGSIIFDNKNQNTKSGGSGCGCSGSVFCGMFYKKLKSGEINKILFIPTGALMSPTSSQQGQSIPSIAHAVAIENI